MSELVVSEECAVDVGCIDQYFGGGVIVVIAGGEEKVVFVAGYVGQSQAFSCCSNQWWAVVEVFQ